MNMEFGLKASVLLEEQHENIAQFTMRSLNELHGSPWSTLKGVRRIAVSCTMLLMMMLLMMQNDNAINLYCQAVTPETQTQTLNL